jgi:hypothetical protein
MDDSKHVDEDCVDDDRQQDGHVAPNDDRHEPPSLVPDGGWGWVVVACSFFVSVIVDGICNTFGVIKGDLDEHFEVSSSTTAWAGSLLSGVYMIAGKLVLTLCHNGRCPYVYIWL